MIVPEGDLSVGSGDVKYPATAAEEKDAILGILEASAAQVKEGDKFFLVTFRWWKQWSDYVRQEGPSSDGSELGPVYCSNASEEGLTAPQRPSSIDNSDLVIQLKREEDIELREPLLENRDYILLPEQVWVAFQKWYGGGPPVTRQVINTGSVQDDRLAVEVYPLRIRLTVTPNESQLTVRVSKQEEEKGNHGVHKGRLWAVWDSSRRAMLKGYALGCPLNLYRGCWGLFFTYMGYSKFTRALHSSVGWAAAVYSRGTAYLLSPGAEGDGELYCSAKGSTLVLQ